MFDSVYILEEWSTYTSKTEMIIASSNLNVVQNYLFTNFNVTENDLHNSEYLIYKGDEVVFTYSIIKVDFINERES